MNERSLRRTLCIVAAWLVILWGAAVDPTDPRARAATPTPTPVAVEDESFLAIRPAGTTEAYHRVTMDAGATRTLAVDIANLGAEPHTGIVYRATALTLANGGFGARMRDEAVVGAAAWVDLPTEEVTLAPGEVQTRAFHVHVPQGTPPGEYVAAVLIENADPASGVGYGTGIAFDLVSRVYTALAIRVPGTLTAGLEIGAARFEPVGVAGVIAIDLRNTGNRYLEPAGTVAITDATGATASTTLRFDGFFTGTDSRIELVLTRELAPGAYTASIELADPERGLAPVRAEGLGFEVVPVATVARVTTPVIDGLALEAVTAADGAMVLMNVGFTLHAGEQAVVAGILEMHVYRDGRLVETVTIDDSVYLDGDATKAVTERYVPVGGWAPGSWSVVVALREPGPAGAVLATGASLAVDVF